MRHLWLLLLIPLSFIAGCSANDLYEDMPGEIQSFVSQYYPNSQLENFTSSETTFTVTLKNGPTMVFDSDYQWIKVDGNGSVLPQVLLFNDLPPALYNYLQETEDTNSVFCLTRNSTTYTAKLLDDLLTYDIATGDITGQEATE